MSGAFFYVGRGYLSFERGDERGKADRGYTDDPVGPAVVYDELLSDDTGAAREDDIWDDSDAFVGFVRGEDRIAAAPDEFFGMFEVEKEGPEAVDSGVRNAVIDDEPTGGSFDRDGVDADLFAVPHTAAREEERPMCEKLGTSIEVLERGQGIDIDGGLDAMEDIVFPIDLFREKTGILVIDTGR